MKELKVLGLNLSPFSKAESFIYLSTMADGTGELCPFKDGVILQSQPAQALPKVEQFLPQSASAISMNLIYSVDLLTCGVLLSFYIGNVRQNLVLV